VLLLCFFVFYLLSIIFSVLIFLPLSLSLSLFVVVVALGILLRKKLTLKLSSIAFSMDDLTVEDSHLVVRV